MYKDELKIAVEAALEAGAIVREAFHQPVIADGIDVIAETAIRKRISQAFPTCGIVGEELGQLDRSAGPSGPVWVIDPLDGTSSFKRGQRGASVSIALLRHGVPVLGVVFSPLYPHDGGDLITWAEGEGLTRNGRSVSRRPLPQQLMAEDTILLPPSAESGLYGSSQLAEPARFRFLPSIAYRLALVAVGDAAGTISWNSPVCWDYAAGHALLRAVGGDLYDAERRTVAYDLDGYGTCHGVCVGASRSLAGELTEKWKVMPSNAAPQNPASPVRRADCTIADSGLLSRAQGCLGALLAADSLGALVEFRTEKQIEAIYPNGVRELADGGTWGTLAGQPTDDGELALTLARCLTEKGCYNEEAAAKAYAAWYLSEPFDIGSTTSQAFSAAAGARSGAAEVARQAASQASQANGALMRIAPLAIFGWSLSTEKLAGMARRDAQLSHPNLACQDANAVFAIAIQLALATGNDGEAVYGEVRDWARKEGVSDDVLQWLTAAEEAPPVDFCDQMGWVRIAFQNAFFQLVHAESLETGVMNTVGRGGDTDTNSCIAGALLGAVHGVEAIPFQWLDRVLTARPMKVIPGVRKPRPSQYWPVDVMALAEELLTRDPFACLTGVEKT